MSTTIATTSNATTVYKGKVAHRSWPQLPEEIIRQIATFYLWDLSATSYCPQSWEAREHWHHRMVYTAIRDAHELEKYLMSICPQWHLALETHLFWQVAIALIDPGDVLAHHAIIQPKVSLNSSSAPAQPTRLTPYRHFRNIITCSCFVCRINHPTTTAGLTLAKRYIKTPFLRSVALCREHDRRRIAFCGLCLRDAPVFDNVMGGAAAAAAAAAESIVACLENEDDDTWPGVDATCRSCRSEWLWKRVSHSHKDREAIGGDKMVSDDWETRQCVDGFVDLAEGSIGEVVALAQEKWWLRKYTRLGEYVMHAVAAARLNDGRVGYDGEEVEEEEEEEEDDEVELMQLSEESGIREIALGDWARARILDGYWFSPADTWYNNALPGKPMAVSAVHPCPWAREPSTDGSSPLPEDDEEGEHPKQSTMEADIPPSFPLCEQAYIAHQRQMRVVLMPAMRNIVRKLVIECSTPNREGKVEDPAIRAARMDMEDVLTALREEEGVWFDGVDWAERGRNDEREREKKERENQGSDSSSTTSSGSRSSNGTSPVLSTTTLQTTPSPSPIPGDEAGKKEDLRDDEVESNADITVSRPVTIAIAPVLDPPRLIWPIPYVPVTASHMPLYSMEAFKAVWREACAPLYHCRCGICERAMAKANAENGNNATPVVTVPSQAEIHAPTATKRDLERPPTIKLHEVIDIDGEGEDEVEQAEYADEEEDEEEGDVEETGEEVFEYPEEANTWALPPSPRPRKRSCDEIAEEGDDEHDSHAKEREARSRTPPKRARTEKGVSAHVVPAESLWRMRKRSSEELEDGNGRNEEHWNSKRAKVLVVEDTDSTESPPPTSDWSLPSSTTTEEADGATATRVSRVDLESTIH